MNSEHNCSICGGIRPHDGTYCMGCGASLRRCGQVGTKSAVKPASCPTCGRTNSVTAIEAGERFKCGWCSIVFERDDFTFVDDRPAINAQKKERMELRKTSYGSRGHYNVKGKK